MHLHRMSLLPRPFQGTRGVPPNIPRQRPSTHAQSRTRACPQVTFLHHNCTYFVLTSCLSCTPTQTRTPPLTPPLHHRLRVHGLCNINPRPSPPPTNFYRLGRCWARREYVERLAKETADRSEKMNGDAGKEPTSRKGGAATSGKELGPDVIPLTLVPPPAPATKPPPRISLSSLEPFSSRMRSTLSTGTRLRRRSWSGGGRSGEKVAGCFVGGRYGCRGE
ncbi:hypothetical protein M427DRAFT_457592 [Gonapodya prolifera JEL478]|uniref:Uncharacterized protein n=1 Tax=Gonapodya prolifera (strain JEL478) TaxID=1344416 RepID=A0A139A2H5_GONPJ|nr:hypothetical protein M427DRAFT_457592 [Gonapodya prolifera JEL478]|eukprot:KXS10951.1 hypothetical protein M427DRAFT_457592 [Gonapodya prolifera JEL478]